MDVDCYCSVYWQKRIDTRKPHVDDKQDKSASVPTADPRVTTLDSQRTMKSEQKITAKIRQTADERNIPETNLEHWCLQLWHTGTRAPLDFQTLCGCLPERI